MLLRLLTEQGTKHHKSATSHSNVYPTVSQELNGEYGAQSILQHGDNKPTNSEMFLDKAERMEWEEETEHCVSICVVAYGHLDVD